MTTEFIERLKRLARSECFYDNEDVDQNIYEIGGGNIDDAFDLGVDTGEVLLAREVLTNMGIEWS